MKKRRIILLFLLMLFLASCSQDNTGLTINFETYGGSTVESVEITETGEYPKLDNPTKDGYVFDGWYLDEGFIEPFNPLVLLSGKDITLHAKWIEESDLTKQLKMIYNLALDAETFNGTYEEWLETVRGPQGADGKEVLFQASDGYIKWQYAGDSSWVNLVSLETLTGANGLSAYQIYLRYFPNYSGTEEEWVNDLVSGALSDGDVLVTYELNGGVMPIGQNNSISIDKYSSIELPIPSKDGYEFLGWFTGDSVNDGQVYNYTVLSSDITLYAKWVEVFTINFVDGNGVILDSQDLYYGELPVYDGLTPVKASDSSYSYTFIGWTPAIGKVTADQTYIATFESTSLNSDAFDAQELNAIFGYDIYSTIPVLNTKDYVVIDDSDTSDYWAFVDMFDWSEDDAYDYIDAADLALEYDDAEEAWIVGDYYLYIYEDSETYEGKTVYGVAIYGKIAALIETWSDVTSHLDDALNYSGFSSILPELDSIENIDINKTDKVILEANSSLYSDDSVVSDYLASVVTAGWIENEDLSTSLSKDVYTYNVSEYQAFAIYFEFTDSKVSFTIWAFNPASLEPYKGETFVNQETLNELEIDNFGKSGLPSLGTYDVLIIPIEINGSPFPSNYEEQLELTFNGTAEATGWQSVSSYYHTSSYGNLNLHFDIADKYTTIYDASYYVGKYGEDADQTIIVETMNEVDSSIDFSKYDINNDGSLDAVIYIYSVAYDGSSNDSPWWAWVFDAEFGVADEINDVDGKALDYYMWASYTFIDDQLAGIDLNANAETFIHEFGHLMAFPDLYDTSGTYVYGPTGGWDMMAYNTGDHGPFNKLMWGWVEPIVAQSGTNTYILDSYSADNDGKDSVILVPYNSGDLLDGDAFDEYLLIILYTPEGLYNGHINTSLGLEDAGVVIYHIDARQLSELSYWGNYFSYNNEGSSDFLVDILEADLNNSIPSDTRSIAMSDLLTSGSVDLSSYAWHQDGNINVQVEVLSPISNDSDHVTVSVTVE